MVRAIIFLAFIGISIDSYAMESAPEQEPKSQPATALQLLQADQQTAEQLVDDTLTYLAPAKQDKPYLDRILRQVALTGRSTNVSPLQARFVVKLLLDRGADPLSPDKFGAIALSQSCYITSYPIQEKIIHLLVTGALDACHRNLITKAPLIWELLELVNNDHIYTLLETILEYDANPDILSKQGKKYKSLLDKFLPKKERFIEAERYQEYAMLIRLLYRYGATTNQTSLYDYFEPQEAQEIERERTVYRADEAYLISSYSPEEHPILSQKPLQELYSLKLEELCPVQTPSPLVTLIANYSGNNSFVRRR